MMDTIKADRLTPIKKRNLFSKIFSIIVFIYMIFSFFNSLIIQADPLAETQVSVSPSSQIVAPSQDFNVSIYCIPDEPIKSYEFKISFDSSIIEANLVSEGDIFNGYSTFFNSGTINNTNGTIINIYGLILGQGNVSDPGTLITINFTSKTIGGTSAISIYDLGITNETTYLSTSTVNGSVEIDAQAPEITDQSPSQGYTGDSYIFNVTVDDDNDNSEDLTVKVDWSHGSNSANDTMVFTGSNYFEKTVTLDLNSVSDLNYNIYTCDTYGNSNNSGQFSKIVLDNDLPEIDNVDKTPSSQEVNGFVNITVDVTDNINVNQIYLNITYPDLSFENFSITNNQSGNTYYCNKTYSILGTHSFYIWANDSYDNGNFSSSNNFIIGDGTIPEITNTVLSNSSPLDTDPSFGWVNVSCEVNDNLAVLIVSLNISKPDGSWDNQSMISGISDNYYYNSSTAFSDCGNYSYNIWTCDCSNNTNVSSSYDFSLPPNWDVNMDGDQNVLDLVAVSNMYAETGALGWTREDVDNNGIIQVFDLVLISNYYGESWWTD